jgi:hypothetical protein
MIKIMNRISSLLFVLFFFISCQCNCQVKSYWLGLGAGPTLSLFNGFITGDINFQITKSIYLAMLADASFHGRQSVGVGGGYIFKKGLFVFTASSGIMQSHYRYFVNSRRAMYISIPIKLQGYLTTRWIGLGISTIYKIESYRNYAGIGLSAILGRIRGKRINK